ncbi:metallophosphoesterase [uncultured Aquimarina sp.]|uniref:metallophosphoesterase family protein n=1 Tax=uncultured Aquimarina sp. TaxID=575652 RepID=UPI002633DF28|nr:metallophosphoesterase [uncultured Aquimarina sp.]
MIRVAIFSDIHGKILLPFKLIDKYQKEFNKKVDLIIQCGDIGAYPNLDNLDKATIRHASHDRDELGFHDNFTKLNEEIETFLKELNVKMICVRGNHEDHDFLDNLEQQNLNSSMFPIDVYKYVWVCKSGELQSFEKNQEELSFVGLGRIGDRKDRKEKRFIQKYEYQKIRKLYKSKKLIELFITHDSDNTGDLGYGSKEIRDVLDNIPFQYHFFGHTGKPYSSELDLNGITQSIKVKELEFNDSGALPENCMIILEKENNGLSINSVPISLINLFTKHNWKYK